MPLRDRLRRLASIVGSLGTIILAALIPKCPLCVAAALSAVGLGATIGASLAPIVRPVAFVCAAIALLASVRVVWRRRHTSTCGDAGCERSLRTRGWGSLPRFDCPTSPGRASPRRRS